ncbi:hypothetical protein [Xanthomonas oryzae]|uniref:Rfc5 protein n=1 Tax=Xanthomonas oryzae pv. oryzae (strain PXO99A) TaxID=360094 RepID=A0A0K0GNR2_XANOP|nr:hypothetical protein [Xanthomonas oryzae]ACD60419.1 Rfc5 protein [Xanthomonas oryzae pv. oryzae PXO99A]AJQ84173.1 hypothetical protein AZ54_17585 [Xanthomonas oryzae pv. oryzae PXO86]QIF22277.1 hypothetical protein G6N84_08560 [Xanthomonas oryzae pv. oryzae]QQD50192.1 hypothetical protein BXO512_003480 [Xanthomonas oryzae pv. oryzae]QUW75471.1 hypothetical protein KCI36_21455 [Xanthomonas oryzae]
MAVEAARSQTLSDYLRALAQTNGIDIRPDGMKCLVHDTAGGMQKLTASRETHDVLV